MTELSLINIHIESFGNIANIGTDVKAPQQSPIN